jgi:hypothetical protein
MDVVRLILLCGHLAGLSLLLGGFLIQLWGDRKIITPMIRGAEIQVVTGVLLVGAREIEHLPDNNAKLAVKLLVALAVLGLAMVGRRRPENRNFYYAVGGLTIVNVLVAVFWS